MMVGISFTNTLLQNGNRLIVLTNNTNKKTMSVECKVLYPALNNPNEKSLYTLISING